MAARRLTRTLLLATLAAAAGAAAWALEPVYFEWNSAVVTPTGYVTVRDMVGHYRERGYSRLVVVGHADASGPAEYNQDLSNRRAEAVGREIQRFGVDPVIIRTEGRGESQPAVATPDGVPEPRNRRAEILFLR